MMKERLTLKELGITIEEIQILRSSGYNIVSQEGRNGRQYYVLTQNENPSLFISGLSSGIQSTEWVELSDIHAGSKQFDKQGLIDVLQRASDLGYHNVHISGDVCDGYMVYGKEHLITIRYLTAEEQSDELVSVLLRFPDLKFISIFGNHDFSFVKAGGINPVYLVEQKVRKEGGQFTFLNGYAGDIIICGVLKRMVHLLSGKVYAKSYPGQVYIRNLLDSHEENVWVKSKKYRIRFLQFGHLHSNIEFESAGIFCTHPGNFQFPNNYTIRQGLVGYQGCRFVNVSIENGKVLEYSSAFIKPRRHF